MNFSGGYANTIGNADNYQLFADTVIQYGDTVTWNKGAHNIKFGFQGWRQRLDTFYSGNNGLSGNMNYDGRYTGWPLLIGYATSCTGASPLVSVKPTSCWAFRNHRRRYQRRHVGPAREYLLGLRAGRLAGNAAT